MEDLDFTKAIQEMLNGERVTRREWNDVRHYALLEDGILSIHKAGESDDIVHPWIINDGDLLGKDWYIV